MLVKWCINAPRLGVTQVINEQRKYPGPSEEEHVSCFHFPSNEERMKIWESKVPREGFKATKYSVLCKKHFTPNDFQIEIS